VAYDLLVRNGRIVDGSGLPSIWGDVGVSGGRIVEVGRLEGPAHRIIDVHGQTIAPGFIDVHCHFDAQAIWDPLCTFTCYHGNTTVVNGNCSLGLAPTRPGERDDLVSMLSRVEAIPIESLRAGIEGDWETIAEYLDLVDSRLGVNVAALIGFSAVRRYVMGEDSYTEQATPEQIDQMKAIIREGIKAGAIGLSFERNIRHVDLEGRVTPCNVASSEELLAVSEALGEVGAGSIQFNAYDRMEMEEGLLSKMSRASGRPLITTFGGGDFEEKMAHLQRTRRDGARITPMLTPFIDDPQLWTILTSNSFDRLPHWMATTIKPLDERRKAFKDPANREGLYADTLTDVPRPDWETSCVARAMLPKNQHLVGKSVGQIAREQGKEPFDTFFDLVLEEDLETMFQQRTGNGPDVKGPAVLSPYTMPGQADSGAHVTRRCDSHVSTHLLSFWVRDQQAISLEDAVRKLTFQSASAFGLHDRGLIRPGMAADLVVFDPDTISPGELDQVQDFPGGATRMRRLPTGIEHTIVNGEVLIEEGEHTGALPGRVARSSAYSR
jgi:N-acyl-D-aspartate/D-glutamate deacylase